MLEKLFKLKENNTTAKTEVMAGITTFMTMAYILAVNPAMLADAGMDKTAVLIATALAAFVGTMAMAFLANYPFALASGMGLNAYFTYTVCGAMGYSWQVALMAVFAEGLIFIVLSLTNVREAIFNAIPTNLKKGVSVGIGLFIAFIGLQNGGIVVANSSTLVSYVDFTGNFKTEGICALLALLGLFITIILYIKHVRGAILFGIVLHGFSACCVRQWEFMCRMRKRDSIRCIRHGDLRICLRLERRSVSALEQILAMCVYLISL